MERRFDSGNEGALHPASDISDGVEASFLTVEGIFDLITANAHADAITVAYALLGFPNAVQTDPSRNTMDEELGVRILAFEPKG